MELMEKLQNLPSLPGVYLMKDSQGGIIYVGKSKNLKNRVRSYFQNSKHHSPKVLKLVNHLKDFEYILTDTEFEAFLLECKLIRELKPMYNKLMKSPLSYPYLRINICDKFPCLEISNDYDENDGCLYWGPYTNKNTVERGILGIKEFCRILCSSSTIKNTVCLNYSLGLCLGMCLGGNNMKQYFEVLFKIIGLLNGSDKSILEEMDQKMRMASEKFDFENAAKYRDFISAVNHLLHNSKIIDFAEENKNIVLVENLSMEMLKFFLIKGDRVLFTEKYPVSGHALKHLKSTLKKHILVYFNDESINKPVEIGKEELDQAQIIYAYLKKNKESLRHAVIPENWIQNKMYKNIDTALDNLLVYNSF